MNKLSVPNITADIDQQIGDLEQKEIKPRLIVLSKSNYYTVTGYVQGRGENDERFRFKLLFHDSATLSADFFYKDLPIFITTQALPGESKLIGVYGD